ncbi:HNH endonuclease, partial [candidate division WOR-3 bacterium]|nr:HNH endonuclease [candidate division WOR-3 bacterium]
KAKEVFSGKIKNTLGLRKSLKELIPEDGVFKERFSIVTLTKHKYARYYLQAIENYHRGEDNPELLVNTNPDSVNLEHILPEKPSRNWPNFAEDDIKSYVKRIGNLTLMRTKENSEFKSSSFSKKKKKYKESEIWITNTIADYNNWTVEFIKQRQNELAELAIKTWSLEI